MRVQRSNSFNAEDDTGPHGAPAEWVEGWGGGARRLLLLSGNAGMGTEPGLWQIGLHIHGSAETRYPAARTAEGGVRGPTAVAYIGPRRTGVPPPPSAGG